MSQRSQFVRSLLERLLTADETVVLTVPKWFIKTLQSGVNAALRVIMDVKCFDMRVNSQDHSKSTINFLGGEKQSNKQKKLYPDVLLFIFCHTHVILFLSVAFFHRGGMLLPHFVVDVFSLVFSINRPERMFFYSPVFCVLFCFYYHYF